MALLPLHNTVIYLPQFSVLVRCQILHAGRGLFYFALPNTINTKLIFIFYLVNLYDTQLRAVSTFRPRSAMHSRTRVCEATLTIVEVRE